MIVFDNDFIHLKWVKQDIHVLLFIILNYIIIIIILFSSNLFELMC